MGLNSIEVMAKDILYAYDWELFCRMKNIPLRAISDGELDPNHVFHLTYDEAFQIGLEPVCA